IAIFGRTSAIFRQRACSVAERLGVERHELSADELPPSNAIAIGTMHRAKGLEFKAVVIMGCEDGVMPSEGVLKRTADDVDRQAFIEQERHLLYVASTRARERLLITYAKEPSRFLG